MIRIMINVTSYLKIWTSSLSCKCTDTALRPVAVHDSLLENAMHTQILCGGQLVYTVIKYSIYH